MSTIVSATLTIQRIYISTGHSYVGRHGLGSVPHLITEPDEVECVAGRGLRGDRFFDHKENYKGQVTLFSMEVFTALCASLNLPHAKPAALRRNLLVGGMDLNELIGREFELQGVRLEGTEECRPCYWMDEALGPGAFEWLKGRGGLRCRILPDGWLRRDGPYNQAISPGRSWPAASRVAWARTRPCWSLTASRSGRAKPACCARPAPV